MADLSDKGLEQYLDGKSPLSDAYRAEAGEQPPATVDAAIVKAAREEAAAGKRSTLNPFGGRWVVPASLAAMLVLAVGLVQMFDKETGMSPLSPAPMEERLMEEAEADRAQPEAASKRLVPEKTRSQDAIPLQRYQAAPEPAQSGEVPGAVAPVEAQPAPDRSRSQAPAASGLAQEAEAARDQWLMQIKELIQQGRQDEANRLIAQFREIYPNYPIDQELGINKK
jgi:hypothetical protein